MAEDLNSSTSIAKCGGASCSLEASDYEARKKRIHSLMERAGLSRERESSTVRLRFRNDAAVSEELGALIALERECCSFLNFTLKTTPQELVLTIGAPENSTAILDEVFGPVSPGKNAR